MANPQLEPALIHEFKNQLAVIYSFSEFLLRTLPEGDVRKDVMEIHNASIAALALLPRLSDHHE
jgi:hypothetical protein